MHTYCIYLKKRKGQPFCSLYQTQISFSKCNECNKKEYKTKPSKNSLYKNNKNEKQKKFVPKKSKELSKLERNRKSVFTDDLEHCIICGKPNINKHEIFYGNGRRQISMKYDLVIPLCNDEHHNQIKCTGIHFDKELCDEWHKKGQAYYEEHIGNREEFIKEFGRNYLD